MSISSTNASYNMFDQTERPGKLFPQDTHDIINHRYLQAAEFIENKNVLEIGVGHGLSLKYLASKAKFFVGGEFSSDNLDLLKKRENICPVLQLDAHKLPFADNSFDVVLAMAMIYYLDFNQFITEAKRILKPGGKIFFCTSNKNVPGFVPSPYTTNYYSNVKLQQLLQSHGLKSTCMGAFKVSGFLLKNKIRAVVKSVIKKIITAVPRGRQYWHGLREKQQGEKFPLPWDLPCPNIDNVKDLNTEQLSLDRIDRVHRIIYCDVSIIK